MKVHLVMPMAGRGSRFQEVGYMIPKPLIPIYDRPFFFWAVQSVRKFIDLVSLDFVVLKEHVETFQIDREIYSYFPEANIHILPKVTEGAVITCLHAIENIDDDDPVIFNDCDHLFQSSKLNYFCEQEIEASVDGILLTFHSDDAKYSFIKKSEDHKVILTVEKEAVSHDAICGCYYFRTASLFRTASEKYLRNCNYKEYFMSGIYNVLISQGMEIQSMETDFHISFGVPEEYEEAKKFKEYGKLL